MKQIGAVLAAGVIGVACRAALAQPLPASAPASAALPVQLVIAPCVPARADEIRRIAGIELGAPLVAIAGTGVVRAEIACSGAALDLRVANPATGRSIERPIDLAGTLPAVRARLLALALAELVRASGFELPPGDGAETGPASLAALADTGARAGASGPASAPANRPTSNPATGWASAMASSAATLPAGGLANALEIEAALAPARAGDRAPARTGGRLVALAGGRRFTGGAALAGAGARGTWVSPAGLGLGIEAESEWAAVSTPLGAVAVWTASAAPTLRAEARWRRWTVGGAAGVRAGLARLAGQASTPGVQASASTALWGGPVVAADVAFEPVAALVLAATVEGGWAALPISTQAGSASVGIARGAWVAADLAIGIAP